MHEAKRAISDDLVSTYFVRTGHVTRNFNCFSNESLLHNLRHSHTKIPLIADVTAEIFKIKNCSVGNLFKYRSYAKVAIYNEQKHS